MTDTDTMSTSDSTEIPASLAGDVQPGDTITLSVVSVDAQNGVVTVAKASEPEAEEPAGSDQMAEEFNNQPESMD